MQQRQITKIRRLMTSGAALLALAGAFATPAAARDPGELACPVAALSEADRRLLDEVAGQSRFEESRPRAIIERAVRGCSDRFRWDEAARGTATVYTRAAIAQALFRSRLAGRQGVDLDAFEAEVRNDAGLIAAAADMRNRPRELDALLLRMWPRVEPVLARNGNDREMITAFGGFFASTAVLEGMKVRFSRP